VFRIMLRAQAVALPQGLRTAAWVPSPPTHSKTTNEWGTLPVTIEATWSPLSSGVTAKLTGPLVFRCIIDIQDGYCGYLFGYGFATD